MNLGVASINKMRVSLVSMALIVLGGIYAYVSLGRLEDPEFTIKEALIITRYPGASAESVAREVTSPIEQACQRLGQLRRVESQSSRGLSIVSAIIENRFTREHIPQVWDELRRRINDVQPLLPPEARGTSLVVDDFGDVFGIFIAITGDGYSQAQLRRYADFLRRELLLVSDVKSVALFGEQPEAVYVELSRPRLAQLGLSEDEVYAKLRAANAPADGGRVRVGEQFVPIEPGGAFKSAEDMLEMVIGTGPGGRQLFLRDVATLRRDYQDPPRRVLRFDGRPAVGLGISTVEGGNVVRMGEGVRAALERLKPEQPVGIEIGEINFQPEAVLSATNAFVFNLIKAVTIVVVVLLLAMGMRAGLMVGLVLMLTILSTLIVMYSYNILMERISLGAFIIALCMLTDNAIVVTEGMKVRIEAGEDKLEVIRDVVAQNQWPLLGATAIAVIAFAAIGLSDHSTGEYCNSLFWVIAISLGISWIAAITFTPLLGYLLFRPLPKEQLGQDPYKSRLFKGYRWLLVHALKRRWAVVAASIALFLAAAYGFRYVPQSFFPPATRPQFMIDSFLPAGTHIRESEAFAADLERFLKAQPGVVHTTSFVGGGGLRFLLVYSPEMENRAFVQLLVNVEDERQIDGLMGKVQEYLDQTKPEANSIAKKFLLGPGKGGRVQARFQGPDSAVLRRLAGEAERIINEDGGALCVRHDWRDREMVIKPKILELAARRDGITREDLARALQTGFQGRVVGLYREPAGAGAGTYPQEERLLPIVARPAPDEQGTVDSIGNMQVWSPALRRMVPLSQVASGTEVEWEDSVVHRRDRFPTITVHADPRSGLPSQLFNRVRAGIEAIELPPGYTMQWGGEYEDSGDARAALAQPLPLAVVTMCFIVLMIFNSIRSTMAVCLVVPLAIIGVTAGLLVTGAAFGFMALLGAIALAGELIKNAIVLVDEFATQKNDLGKPPYAAVVDGAVSRLRPVMLVAVTTVLGMIPLLQDPFFSAMAVTIMFGLAFACVLTMIVVPSLYVIFFRIRPDQAPTPARAE